MSGVLESDTRWLGLGVARSTSSVFELALLLGCQQIEIASLGSCDWCVGDLISTGEAIFRLQTRTVAAILEGPRK